MRKLQRHSSVTRQLATTANNAAASAITSQAWDSTERQLSVNCMYCRSRWNSTAPNSLSDCCTCRLTDDW